jgi:hypothetical protein
MSKLLLPRVMIRAATVHTKKMGIVGIKGGKKPARVRP